MSILKMQISLKLSILNIWKKFYANFKNSKSHFTFLISLCVVLGCITPVHATLESDVSSILNYVRLTNTDVADIEANIRLYLPTLSQIKIGTDNIYTRLYSTNQYLSDIKTIINTNIPYLQNISNRADSIHLNVATIRQNSNTINTNVQQLADVLANSTDAAIRNDMESRVGAVSSDFLSSSGNNSVSLSDIGNLSSGMSDLKSGLSSTASPDDAFSWLNGTDAWGWFDVSTKNDLDRVNSSRGNTRSSADSSTPYLDSYYNAIYGYLGIGGDER